MNSYPSIGWRHNFLHTHSKGSHHMGIRRFLWGIMLYLESLLGKNLWLGTFLVEECSHLPYNSLFMGPWYLHRSNSYLLGKGNRLHLLSMGHHMCRSWGDNACKCDCPCHKCCLVGNREMWNLLWSLCSKSYLVGSQERVNNIQVLLWMMSWEAKRFWDHHR